MTGKSGERVRAAHRRAGRAARSVRVRVFSKDDGALSLRVNDNKDINGKLAKGWSTLELTVPAGQLKEGENALSFFAKPSEAAVAWIQIGGATPRRRRRPDRVLRHGAEGAASCPKDGACPGT